MHIIPDKKAVVKSALGCLVVTAIFMVTAVFISLIPESDNVLAFGFGFIGIMWLIGFPLRVLWLNSLGYDIESTEISIHKGILTKTQQNIPYQKITDFMLVRSPFDRILGIASIQVQTAGQAAKSYEGVLLGLTEWDRLLGDLRAKLKALGGDTNAPGEPAHESPAEKEVLQAILSELKAIRTILETK